MNKKIKGNVLVYARRRYGRFFYEISQRTFEGKISYFTDWPDISSDVKMFENFMPDFYQNYEKNWDLSINNNLSDYDLQNIIARCRLLRALPYQQSVRMVYAMYQTLSNLFEVNKPNFFLAQSVEHYISDLFCRVCHDSGVIPLTIMDGSVKNTILFFQYGEYNYVRNPNESDCRQALEQLLDNSYHLTYGQVSNQYTFLKHFNFFAVNRVKYLIFFLLCTLTKDYLNFRFLTTLLSIEGGGHNRVLNYQFHQYINNDWKLLIDDSDKKVVYIPLSFTPECSTDYWLNDLKFIDYERFIVSLCKILSCNYTILIKDHWAMMGQRDSSFYKSLKSIPGIIIAPPEENGRAILEKIDRIIVGSGTAGVEAALRGKRVVTLCKPYYYLEGFYIPIVSYKEIYSIPEQLETFCPPKPSQENQYSVVTKFLESTLEGSIRVNTYLNSENNLNVTSNSLKSYLNKLNQKQLKANIITS